MSILFINASPNKNGNTAKLAKEQENLSCVGEGEYHDANH